MKKARNIIFLVLTGLFYLSSRSFAQDADSTKAFFQNIYYQWLDTQQDSSYIENHTTEIAGRIIAVRKYNYFRISDRNNGTTLTYQPNTKVSIGLGITHRWFSIDVTFKSGLAEEKVDGTNAFDFQGRVYSPKQYLEMKYKYYFGYYLSNTSNLSAPVHDSSRVRNDIRSSYIGLEYMYAINYGRFSFKAPFVYNEIQKKSVGSIVLGASFVSFLVDGDYSFVPKEVEDDFNPELSVSSLNTIHLAINAGYMYSLIFLKNFYITLGVIPGLSLTAGDYKVEQRTSLGIKPSLKFKTMNALGYNSRRYYAGVMFEGDVFSEQLDKMADIQNGHSKLKFFVGYRFKRK